MKSSSHQKVAVFIAFFIAYLVGEASAQPRQLSDVLTGTWMVESNFEAKDLTINTSGYRRFIPKDRVEDKMTMALTLPQIAGLPVVLEVTLESRWTLQEKDRFLCETLGGFNVRVLDRPDERIVPAFLVAQLIEQTQMGFQHRVNSKVGTCNAIELISRDHFKLREGVNGKVISFQRAR